MFETMKVRAKFLCVEIGQTLGSFKNLETDKYEQGKLYTYKFNAVTSGSPENELFWAYTPSGQVNLSSVRVDLFEVGQEYYLDFSPAWIKVSDEDSSPKPDA